MADDTFLPALSSSDIDRATQVRCLIFPDINALFSQVLIQLIQQAYSPSLVDPATQRALQHELNEIQKLPQAWGLVIPLLNNQDPNVQFFGAHTAQVKIARDWWVSKFLLRHSCFFDLIWGKDFWVILSRRLKRCRLSPLFMQGFFLSRGNKMAFKSLDCSVSSGHALARRLSC
jgi:hypothetical protein